LAAVLVAAAAFVWASTRPPTYMAEATTVVARPPIEVDVGTILRFRPEVTITFETYATLAFSRSVLEAVLPHHEAGDLRTLRTALALERVAGTAAQPSTFLAVSHSVRSRDPEVAARAATAWVDATVATARALLLENLDVLEDVTGDSLTVARERARVAEEALEGLWAEAAPDALRRGITAADQAALELEAMLREIDRDLGERRAERASLLGVDAGLTSGVVLMDAPDVLVDVAGAVASLDARIAALEARREGASSQLVQVADERSRLARSRADATVRIAALEREVSEALQSVAVLTAIDPNVALVAQMAPSGVRVLSQPTVPGRPEPTRAALIAVLAALVTTFAGVVVVLLAEAVRPPSAARVRT
jgi:uncharacterized protein involved in exopolysaccharide biosynthesis